MPRPPYLGYGLLFLLRHLVRIDAHALNSLVLVLPWVVADIFIPHPQDLVSPLLRLLRKMLFVLPHSQRQIHLTLDEVERGSKPITVNRPKLSPVKSIFIFMKINIDSQVKHNAIIPPEKLRINV